MNRGSNHWPALFSKGLLAPMLLWAGLAASDTVDPFLTAVPVSGRDAELRAEAMAEALLISLIKVSGDRQRVPRLSAAEAERALQQYRYLERPAEDPEAPELALEVRFAPDAVEALAARLGLPIWPLERGTSTIWVVIEEEGTRRFLGERESDGPLLDLVDRIARRRAMPVALPLLDLEDQAALNPAEVWGGFADRIRTASRRYGADHVLSGRLQRVGDQWVGRWVLDVAPQVERFDSRGGTMEDCLAQAVEAAADRLARASAVYRQGGMQNAVTLTVLGVDTASTYAAVVAYVEALSVVEAALPRRIAAGTVDFELSLVGDVRALERVLALDEALLPAGVEAGRGPESLAYRVARLPGRR